MRQNLIRLFLLALFCEGLFTTSLRAEDATVLAERISDKIQGKAALYIGCRDEKLIAEIAREKKILIQALCFDENTVKAIRNSLQAQGLYGQVTACLLPSSYLPYADNLCGLVVADRLTDILRNGITLSEILRVVSPNGIALFGDSEGKMSEATLKTQLAQCDVRDVEFIKANGLWAKVKKNMPKGMDAWPQYYHGPDNNKVSNDTLMEPATGFRWLAGPYYPLGLRTDSIVAVVLESGKLITISSDEIENYSQPPEKIRLYLSARDAFSGILCWKRPFEGMVPLGNRDFHADYATSQDKNYTKPMYPMEVGHRQPFPLTSKDDRVFTCIKNALAAIEIETGKTVCQSDPLDSIPDWTIHDGTTIYVSTEKRIYALDLHTLKERWHRDVQSMDITLGEGKLFFLDVGKKPYDLVCMDPVTQKDIWRCSADEFYSQEEEAKKKVGNNDILKRGWPYYFGKDARETLKQVSLRMYCDLGEKAPTNGPKGVLALGTWETLHGVSAADGKKLWKLSLNPHGKGFNKQAFFTQGLIWTAEGAPMGLDPLTGKVVKETRGGGTLYQRCQESIATIRYFISGRNVKFIPVGQEQKRKFTFDAIRGSCRMGMLPAYGLLYNFPMSCTCLAYNIRGYQGIEGKSADAKKGEGSELTATPDEKRLLKGTAWGAVESPADNSASSGWSTFKGNFRRSGGCDKSLPENLEILWSVKAADPLNSPLSVDWSAKSLLHDPLTGPTLADGMIFMALPDRHQVKALDRETGKLLWNFTAGGRIDSPPTISNGYCLFGCHDGRIYCLRARDGELVWRFNAAPADCYMIAYGQFESKWPVAGSILVVDGVAYAAAGRSSLADGGIWVMALKIKDGKLLWKKNLQSSGQKTGFNGQADILVSDGKAAYLCTSTDPWQFDLKNGENKAVSCEKPNVGYLQTKEAGLLEGTWRRTGGALRTRKGHRLSCYGGAAGILMAFNSTFVCGYKVLAEDWRWPAIKESHLFGATLNAQGLSQKEQWSITIKRPSMVESMLIAGQTLYAAGPKNVYETAASGMLAAILLPEGKEAKTWTLSAPPVYEGLSADQARLFVALQDGTLICFGKK